MASLGFEPETFQLVAERINYATACPHFPTKQSKLTKHPTAQWYYKSTQTMTEMSHLHKGLQCRLPMLGSKQLLSVLEVPSSTTQGFANCFQHETLKHRALACNLTSSFYNAHRPTKTNFMFYLIMRVT
jgi:hypothetical protein